MRALYLLRHGTPAFPGGERLCLGRTDLPLASYDKLIVSIMDKLMGLDGDVRILPGHGGDSTIAQERTLNPFLEPWGEAEDVD